MKIQFQLFTVFLKYWIYRKNLLAVAVFHLLTLISAVQAREDNLVLPLSRGGSHIFFTEINTGYYYTESNYTNFNKSQSLQQVLGLNNNSSAPFFHYINMDFGLGYAFTDWFEIEAFSSGFGFAQSGSGNGKDLRFSGPQINRVGMAFRSQQDVEGVFGFIPEFSFSIPLVEKQNLNKPVTDDGSMYFTPSIWLHGIIGGVFYPFIYTGFKWRSKSISSLLQWKAGVMLKGEMAELGINSYGFWSVIRDKSSPSRGDHVNLLKTTNAGSLKFLSTNPGLIGFMGWIAWHFPYVTLRLHGDFDITGTQYSKGYSFLASLIMEIGSKEEKVKGIFSDKPDFEPQIMENEQAVQDIFENAKEDNRLEEETETLLKETEHAEEERME